MGNIPSYKDQTPLERNIYGALFEQHMRRVIERGRKRISRRELAGGCTLIRPQFTPSDDEKEFLELIRLGDRTASCEASDGE